MNIFISDEEIKGLEEYFGDKISDEDRDVISSRANEIYNSILTASGAKKLAIALAVYKAAYEGDIEIESDFACDYQDSVINSF